ncbi:MAG TPA: ATP-binding cassette domain-containing protein, partial [Geminicoccaceae bacterium]|nr:ATP-binding cassette domain-containing protein [Geminicoccaceae bacterium]
MQPDAPPPLLAVEGLSVAYGGLRALDGVSLALRAGEFVAVVGPNGAGKTTLFKAISGAVDAAGGRIAYEGRDLLAVPPAWRAHLGIAHVPEGRQVFRTMTVLENLEMGAYARADRGAGARPRPVPGFGRAPRPARRHALGRRAADARHRPRPRLLAQAAAAGRALDGPRADHRRRD